MPMIRTYQQQASLETQDAPNVRIDDSVGQGLQQVGSALSRAGASFAAEQRQKDAELKAQQEQLAQYKNNLALETFKNNTLSGFQNLVDNGAQDGSDILPSIGDPLKKEFDKIRESITDPVQKAKADYFFENFRGELALKGQEAATRKGSSYILATTMDSIKKETELGNLSSREDTDNYFEQVVKPRIDLAVKDPLKRQEVYAEYGRTLAQDFIKRHPELAMPQKVQAKPAPGAGLSAPGRTGSKLSGGSAANVIAHFEGFRTGTYWDVNHHRVGFGSDTITRADGSVVTVQKGMTVTKEDALRDLNRRVSDLQGRIAGSIGNAWGGLSDGAKAALTSVAYNYGSLPNSVMAAAKTGNGAAISQAILGLRGHNGGINASRRLQEAAMAANGSVNVADVGSIPESSGYQMPSQPTGGVFDYLPQSDWNAISKAGLDSFKDSLDLGIETGETTRDDILTAPIDDGNKAVLLRRWNERNEGQLSVAQFQSDIAAGKFIDVNDSNTRKAAGLMLDQSGGGAAIAQGDPAAVRTMVDLYRQTGIVPDNAKGAITSMMNSGDDTKINTALGYLGRMYIDNPRAFQKAFDTDLETKTKSFLKQKDFATPTQIAEDVKQAVSPETAAIREDREKIAVKAADNITLDQVRNLFDTSLLPFTDPEVSVAPDAEAALMLDYRNLYVKAYKLTGDEDKAKEAAAQQLSRVWGVSAANNGRIMKHPPEALLGPNAMVNGSYDGMGAQIGKELVSMGYAVHQKRSVGIGAGAATQIEETVPMEHYLFADQRTLDDAASGKLPSYQVWVMRENGQYEQVRRRFAFAPRQAQDEYAKQFKIDQEQARQRRGRMDKALEPPPMSAPDGMGLGGSPDPQNPGAILETP